MSRFNKIRIFIASNRDARVIRFGERLCRFYLDCHDNARSWVFEQNGEMLIMRHVLARTQGPLFDVGAHSGVYALLMSKFANERTIHSFEPVAKFAALARANCANVPNIQVHECGLSDADRTEVIFSSSQHPQTSGTMRFTHDFESMKKFDEIKCQFISGDNFCLQNAIDNISFLKIDVEGMERRVLSGFEKMLRKEAIETIQLEHGPTHAETGDTLRILRKLLGSYGYETFAIYPNGLRLPSNVGVDNENFRGRNLFAVHSKYQQKYQDLVIGSC